MEPRIQYARTADGVSIAFWTMGRGEPLVWVHGILRRPSESRLLLDLAKSGPSNSPKSPEGGDRYGPGCYAREKIPCPSR